MRTMEEEPEAESDAWACERSRPRRSSSHKSCHRVQSNVSMWVYYAYIYRQRYNRCVPFSLYTILSVPMLYGVWHIKEGIKWRQCRAIHCSSMGNANGRG